MLCVERVHRLMMTTLLVVIILLFINAYEIFALALLVFMAVMMAIWAIFDFCPALRILSTFMKPCRKG